MWLERRGWTTEAAEVREEEGARGYAMMNQGLEVDPGGERSRARILHVSVKYPKSQ